MVYDGIEVYPGDGVDLSRGLDHLVYVDSGIAPSSDGNNLYAYVRSNPLSATDPSGLWTLHVCAKGCKPRLFGLWPGGWYILWAISAGPCWLGNTCCNRAMAAAGRCNRWIPGFSLTCRAVPM